MTRANIYIFGYIILELVKTHSKTRLEVDGNNRDSKGFFLVCALRIKNNVSD